MKLRSPRTFRADINEWVALALIFVPVTDRVLEPAEVFLLLVLPVVLAVPLVDFILDKELVDLEEVESTVAEVKLDSPEQERGTIHLLTSGSDCF